MRNTSYIFLFFTIMFYSCENDQRLSTDLINNPATASSSPNTENKFASIEFDEYELDFGTIAAGKRLTFELNFTNDGDAPLIISNVHSQCGCTVAKDWPKEIMEPGEGGVIKVDFDSTDRTGVTIKRVDVITNSRPAITQLTIKGNVIGPDFTKEDLE